MCRTNLQLVQRKTYSDKPSSLQALPGTTDSGVHTTLNNPPSSRPKSLKSDILYPLLNTLEDDAMRTAIVHEISRLFVAVLN